jgi:hypothetical protein
LIKGEESRNEVEEEKGGEGDTTGAIWKEDERKRNVEKGRKGLDKEPRTRKTKAKENKKEKKG